VGLRAGLDVVAKIIILSIPGIESWSSSTMSVTLRTELSALPQWVVRKQKWRCNKVQCGQRILKLNCLRKGFYEHGNEHSVSIKDEEFLH